jgi:hypothetical protein
MERYIILLVVICAVPFVMRILYKKAKNKQDPIKDDNIIRQPKQYLYVGIASTILWFCAVLFILFCPERMIADYEDGIRLWLAIPFAGMTLPGIFIILISVNWKIEVGETEFTFTNTFGRKRTYQYSDVEVRNLKACTRFYHKGKHIVGISFLQENFDALEDAIFAYRYRKMGEGKEDLHRQSKRAQKRKTLKGKKH